MSSPGTTTAAPSLLGDWTPGRPGCLQQKDWWIWSYDGANRDARTVLGGPSQTTDCFPTAGGAHRNLRRNAVPAELLGRLHQQIVRKRNINTWSHRLRIFGRRASFIAVRNRIKSAIIIFRVQRTLRSSECRGWRWCRRRRATLGSRRIFALPTEAQRQHPRQVRAANDNICSTNRGAATAAPSATAMVQTSHPPPGYVHNQHTGGSMGYSGEHGTGTGNTAYWDDRVKHEAMGSTPSPEPTSHTMVPGRFEMDSGDARTELPSYRH
ncbi:uncharacterized protein PG998_007081 [Apiospora kogelbergensis]|uniref:uncharacterized protein n=1 Tax=Apiospora kogelbergensis TaxID=1337665 RepID=UPI00312EF938